MRDYLNGSISLEKEQGISRSSSKELPWAWAFADYKPKVAAEKYCQLPSSGSDITLKIVNIIVMLKLFLVNIQGLCFIYNYTIDSKRKGLETHHVHQCFQQSLDGTK